MENLLITIKTLYGFEQILKEELEELGYKKVEILNRAVQLKGGWEDVYRLNYRCRLAISVLVEIKTFYIYKEDDLYKEAKKIDWTAYFDKDKTFAVKGAVFSTLFKHSQYPMLLIKDAIADVFRDKTGDRPNVNIKTPQVMFDVYIKDKNVTVSLNTSGVPLFQRGYRQETGEAPINEVLAAGLLRLSGWDRKSTLIDPMCGAGTIPIEAALWAADIPAMIERTHYAFKNFKSYQPEVWEKIQNEGNKKPIALDFEILGFDIDGEMVQKAKRNSRVAPIGNMVKFERQDFLTLKPEQDKGMLLFNPPYGERLGEEVEELYEKMGDLFKQNFQGFNCWIISSNADAFKNIGLKPNEKIKVFNGNLECSFREYQIFEGSHKEWKREESQSQKESKSELKILPEKPKIQKRAPKKYDRPEKNFKREVKKEIPKPLQEEKTTSSKYSQDKYSSVKYAQDKYQSYSKKEQKEESVSQKQPKETSLKEEIERIKKKRGE